MTISRKPSLLNPMLGVLACFRAGVLECLRVRVFRFFACINVWWLPFYMFGMSWRALKSYMLAVLKYSTCLRACGLLSQRLSYFFLHLEVKFQKFLYRKTSFYSEYLEPTWTSMKEFFARKKLTTKSFQLFLQKGFTVLSLLIPI